MPKLLIILLIIKITNGFFTDPSKIFYIEWSNSSAPSDSDDLEKFNVTSSMGEKYTCIIAKNEPKNLLDNFFYQGPLAIDFIEHLFNKEICSYRLEPFWTYEVCHGRHIRQYNEILDGSLLKLQQHTLGKMGLKEKEMVIRKKRQEETTCIQNLTFKFPTKKVASNELPYVEISMADGSFCEHDRRKLRKSNVYYMCHMNGNHDIQSVKEVASCVYEIIIFTPLLCAHPKFRPKRIPASPITCYANGKSPKLPYNLAKIYGKRRIIVGRGEKRTELLSYDKKSDNVVGVDSTLIKNFLSGKNCVSGGTGRWKYEFCYGKYINQYTYGMFGLKTTVCLGKFDLDKHLEWISNHPNKKPKPVGFRTYITQLYTNGCISNMTGRTRQTEVKLKCLENSANKNALVVYLYETNFGEYLLGIESPILCQVIPLADENGLIVLKT